MTGEAVTQVAFGNARPSNVMGLIDDDHIPPRFFQKVPVPTDILERVDAHDDPVINLEGVLRCWNAEAEFRDTLGI